MTGLIPVRSQVTSGVVRHAGPGISGETAWPIHLGTTYGPGVLVGIIFCLTATAAGLSVWLRFLAEPIAVSAPPAAMQILWPLSTGIAALLLALLVLATVSLTSGFAGGTLGRSVLWGCIAALPFAAAGVMILVAVRLMTSLAVLSRPYQFLNDPWTDPRQDALVMTFAGLIALAASIAFSRWQFARAEAVNHRITIKSGKTTFVFDARDILFIKGAANYAELYTRQGCNRIRATLTDLGEMFHARGLSMVRIHRSFMVAPDAVLSAERTRAGDCRLLLWDGTVVTASRRFAQGIRQIERLLRTRRPH